MVGAHLVAATVFRWGGQVWGGCLDARGGTSIQGPPHWTQTYRPIWATRKGSGQCLVWKELEWEWWSTGNATAARHRKIRYNMPKDPSKHLNRKTILWDFFHSPTLGGDPGGWPIAAADWKARRSGAHTMQYFIPWTLCELVCPQGLLTEIQLKASRFCHRDTRLRVNPWARGVITNGRSPPCGRSLGCHFWDGEHVTRNQRLLVTPNNQRIKLGDGLNHLAWGSFQSSRNHYSSFPTICFRGHISFWGSIPKKRWQQFPWFQGFCRVAYSAVIKLFFGNRKDC